MNQKMPYFGGTPQIFQREDGQIVFHIKNGDGEIKMTCYSVFPGIDLIYNDVHARRSLSSGTCQDVQIIGNYALIDLILSFGCIKNANGLQLGNEMAKNVGIRVNLSLVVLSAVSAFLATITISQVGMIGFVGLVAPYIARMLVGSDYKVLIPTSLLTGSLIVLLADTVGRSI